MLLTDARPAGSTETNTFLITRLRVTGGNLAADVSTEALPAVLQLDSGPAEAILVGKNGGIACLRPTTGNMPMAPCAP